MATRQSVIDRPKRPNVSRPAIVQPSAPRVPKGVPIEDTAKFMLDNGILFECNRTFFHQLGLAMMVQQNASGKRELVLYDFSSDPTVTFDPPTFNGGRTKWRVFYKSKGAKAHFTRKKKLGFINQTHPDIREQPKQFD